MSNNLISLEFYKQIKKINSTTEDAAISSIISSVSDYVKTYLGRTLNAYLTTPKVEYFKGDKAKYYLSEFPVISINSVELFEGNSYTPLVTDEDYYLDEELDAICTVSSKAFSNIPYNNRIKITYLGGYNSIPGEIALAVVDLVTYYHKSEYVQNKQVGGTDSIQLAIPEYKLPKHITRVLEMYRQGFAF